MNINMVVCAFLALLYNRFIPRYHRYHTYLRIWKVRSSQIKILCYHVDAPQHWNSEHLRSLLILVSHELVDRNLDLQGPYGGVLGSSNLKKRSSMSSSSKCGAPAAMSYQLRNTSVKVIVKYLFITQARSSVTDVYPEGEYEYERSSLIAFCGLQEQNHIQLCFTN
jgi:hypothetical protein